MQIRGDNHHVIHTSSYDNGVAELRTGVLKLRQESLAKVIMYNIRRITSSLLELQITCLAQLRTRNINARNSWQCLYEWRFGVCNCKAK